MRGERLLGVGREIFWGRRRSFQEGFWLVFGENGLKRKDF